MSLVEFHPDLSKLVKEMGRIANCLERLCRANGIPLTDPELPKATEIEEVTYATDEGAIRDEMEAAVRAARNQPPLDPEDEDIT